MSPSNSLNLFQSHMGNVYPRRLLLHTPLYNPPPESEITVPGDNRITPESSTPESSFDANVVMILAVLLCALICALGLNSIVRCALRCSNRMTLEPESGSRVANTGVRRKALREIPIQVYSDGLKLPGANSECAICLSEFATGERVRVLPKCKHGFHVKCIDRWLMSRNSCPTCRRCLFKNSSQKVSGCTESSSVTGTTQSLILPLDPEGMLVNYRL